MRVGLIGYGLAGKVFHAPLIAVTQGLRLETIVTGNPERRKQALADYPGVQVVDSAERLWESATELFPDLARNPAAFRTSIETVLATIRGLALLKSITGDDRKGVDRRWREAREHLRRMLVESASAE